MAENTEIKQNNAAVPQSSASSVFEFMRICYNLKTTKRTGWVRNKILLPESIADHLCFISLLSLLIDDPNINREKCVKMALVHDLGEAIVGDITPSDPISKEEKQRMEKEAFEKMCFGTLGGPIGQEIFDLWCEYEDGATAEGKVVKQLDKLEMILQASEYEKSQGKNLEEFFKSTEGVFKHPQIVSWVEELYRHRSTYISDINNKSSENK
jgi:putative hydrolase of HD superfamily